MRFTVYRDRLRRSRRSRRLWLAPRIWKRRLVFWGGGIVVGITAAMFTVAADQVQRWFQSLTNDSPYLPLMVTPIGFALSVAVSRRYFPGSQGSGIPQAIAARQLSGRAARGALLSLRIAFGKVCLTLLGLATGASIGREGPTVQIGASVLHAVGRIPGGTYRGLILAGSAAGVAAAFNTPLAGIVFAIEEMSRSFEQRTSGLVLTAVIIAGSASLALLGNYAYFGHTVAVLNTPTDWIAVPVCGMLGGLMGGFFSHVVVAVARGLPGKPGLLMRAHPVIFAALCGLIIAALGVISDNTIYGTGYEQAKRLLEGDVAGAGFFGLFKMVATILSSISGIPGGIFSPSLSVGSGLGANVAALFPTAANGAIVLLGMVAYFSGVVQAPITAFVIVLEMTSNQTMTLPLMAASLIAYGVSRLIGAPAIYHALAENFTTKMP